MEFLVCEGDNGGGQGLELNVGPGLTIGCKLRIAQAVRLNDVL